MKAVVGILISDKIDFKTKCITRHKEKCFITIKKIHQETTIINVYVLDDRATKYTKQKLTELKWESDHFKITLNIPLSATNRCPPKKISEDKISEQHYQKTWPYWYL